VEQDLSSPIPARSDRGMNGGEWVSTRWGAGGKGKEGGTGLPSAHSLSSLPSPPPPLPPQRGGPDVADLLREDVPMLQIF